MPAQLMDYPIGLDPDAEMMVGGILWMSPTRATARRFADHGESHQSRGCLRGIRGG